MQSRASSTSVPRSAERPPSRITRWSSSGPSASSARAGAGDEVDVVGGVVADGRHGEELQEVGGLVPVGHHPLHAHHRDVDARQRRDQARVALVLDDAEGAGLGHAEVDPRDADVGGARTPRAGAGGRGPPAPRGRWAGRRRSRPSNSSRTCDLLRCTAGATMWLGCWPASCRIHSPRSVSTTRSPASSMRLVELDLLGGHRLRLGHQRRPPRRRQVGDVAAGRGRRRRPARRCRPPRAPAPPAGRAARADRGCCRAGSPGRAPASRRTGTPPMRSRPAAQLPAAARGCR